MVAVSGIYGEPMAPWSGVPQSVYVGCLRRGRWCVGVLRVQAAPTHPGLIASGFPWGSAGHRETMVLADRIASFLAIVRDRGTGRVDLGRLVTVRYAPAPQDRELLRLARARAAPPGRPARSGSCRSSPAARLAPGPALRDGAQGTADRLELSLFTTTMSSCRIGQSSRTSVADPDGQVHGVSGLWVTDSSAMPQRELA